VGSAISLDIRLRDYLSNRFLKKEALRNKSIIYKSLLKYDYNNFTLDVLEYCEPNMLIRREQHYIDMLKPEYNICLIAGSGLGTKDSSETLLKFTRRKFSPEALINFKVAKAGKIPSPLTKINQLLATGHITTIVNIKDESIKVYNSVRTAAKAIGVSHPTLLDYINNKKLLKDTYLISRKKEKLKMHMFNYIWTNGRYSSIGRTIVCGIICSLFEPGYPPIFTDINILIIILIIIKIARVV
jgi:group I intron endonuclease